MRFDVSVDVMEAGKKTWSSLDFLGFSPQALHFFPDKKKKQQRHYLLCMLFG